MTHASLIDFSVGLRARFRGVDLLEVQILRTKSHSVLWILRLKHKIRWLILRYAFVKPVLMPLKSEGSDDFSLCAEDQGCPVHFTGNSKWFRHLLTGKVRELYNIENFALLGYYSACSDHSLRTFRVNLSAPSSSVKNSGRRFIGSFKCQGSKKKTSWISFPLKMGPIDYPETSVRNYHCTLSNNPEEHSSLYNVVSFILNRNRCA